MARRPRKVSFVLQFRNSGEPPDGEPNWRATLEEVESGARHTCLSFEDIASGLAEHGVHLPHEQPDEQVCEACRLAARRARELR